MRHVISIKDFENQEVLSQNIALSSTVSEQKRIQVQVDVITKEVNFQVSFGDEINLYSELETAIHVYNREWF